MTLFHITPPIELMLWNFTRNLSTVYIGRACHVCEYFLFHMFWLVSQTFLPMKLAHYHSPRPLPLPLTLVHWFWGRILKNLSVVADFSIFRNKNTTVITRKKWTTWVFLFLQVCTTLHAKTHKRELSLNFKGLFCGSIFVLIFIPWT